MASKRKALCVDEKVCVIRAIEKGEKKSDVGRRLELSQSTVATIWKNKEKILQAALEGKSPKKLRKPKFEDLDQAMLTWFNNQRQNNVPISGPIVKAKAEKFAKQLGVINFKASEGWLGKFKHRHKITYGKMNGEARDVDMNIADAGSSSRKVGAPSASTRLPEAEKIIASVYRYLQSEYDNLKSSTGDACDLSPLANILKRTAAATGVSKRTVTDILEKGKRPANSEVDTAQNKRTKFIPTFEDDDVSPIEEESSCGSPADVEEPDENEEEDQYDSIETLKVELDEEDEDHSEDMEKKIRVDLASCEKTSAIHHLLSPARTEVKIESQDMDYQTSSVAHRLLSSTRVETQHEPSDVLHRQASHAELQTAPDATLDPVKTEPWDNDTDT